MQSMLGKVSVEEGVQVWPLSGMMAHRFGKGAMALIGEAAHVFPPIGAQGLNLSLRDIMALTDILCDRAELPIPADSGDRFDRRRRADIMTPHAQRRSPQPVAALGFPAGADAARRRPAYPLGDSAASRHRHARRHRAGPRLPRYSGCATGKATPEERLI